MGFDDFETRWRQMEEASELPFLASWARLPAGDYLFLRPEELAFLREIGLPSNAPCFSFEEVTEGMPRVDQVYGPQDEELWARIGRENVAMFRMLGTDSSGNPVALHIETHEIWMLDHEGAFTPYSLVSTGLLQFAESLLLFKRAESQEGEVDVASLQGQLRAVDARAAEEGAFWHGYAEDLADFI